jgi:Autotransporter beta-domain
MLRLSRGRVDAFSVCLGVIVSIFLALATAGPAHAQWTIQKTADRSTFSAAGETINYTYQITNTTVGNYFGVNVADVVQVSNVPIAVNCPSTDIPGFTTLTCTSSYMTTAADVARGSIINVATADGSFPNESPLPTITATATVTYLPPTGSITIVKNASGGNGTFAFTSTVAGATSFNLTTAGGTASQSFANLAPGTYTFTETNLPSLWKLTALTCVGDAGGTPTTVDLAGRSAAVGLDSGENITCTFTNTFNNTQDQTQQIIRRFLAHRMSLMLYNQPDRPRFLRRLPGSLWGGGSSDGGGPFNFVGTSNGLDSHMVFSTSLSQIARAESNGDSALPAGALGYAAAKPFVKAPRPLAPDPGIDVWVEAHYARFGANLGNVDNDGNFGVVYVGADRLVTPDVLVGALVQFDWMKESSAAVGSSVAGRGAMAGPYVSARLSPHLFFDARGAWGVSTNDIDPFGLYTDNFSTNRWLLHGKLTGNWNWQDFRVTPSAALDYIQERQHDYTDSLGVPIPAQTVSLGRLSFGPEIARRFVAADGSIYEPLIALTGNWDFERPNVASIAGQPVSGQAFHGSVQAGLLAQKPGGLSMRFVVTYDGIGDSTLHAYGAQVWFNMPFH